MRARAQRTACARLAGKPAVISVPRVSRSAGPGRAITGVRSPPGGSSDGAARHMNLRPSPWPVTILNRVACGHRWQISRWSSRIASRWARWKASSESSPSSGPTAMVIWTTTWPGSTDGSSPYCSTATLSTTPSGKRPRTSCSMRPVAALSMRSMTPSLRVSLAIRVTLATRIPQESKSGPGVRNPCLTWTNLCSIIYGMGIASTEIRRISPARPCLSVAAEVSGSLASRTADPLGGGMLPVLPALRELLPRGGLARGSVVTVAEFGLLILALAAGASADGAWCGIAGVPEAGVLAAAGLGLDAERTLLVPDPGPAWPPGGASLLDGCELVLLRPPAQAPAQVRQRLEATLRRGRGVLLVAGDWPGAQVRLRVITQRWTGLADGHGRLRACGWEGGPHARGGVSKTR